MVSSLFVVTGASRGLGREVAVMFGRRTEALKQAKPFFVLLARGAEGLKATKEQILNVSPDAEVLTQSVDLSKVPECSNTLREAIATISSGQTFDNAILVNNAGIIKPLTPVLQIEPVDFMESFSLSVLGPLELLKAFNKVNSQKKTVVNISSIMALAPRDSCGVYSTVKAASDAMHRSLAKEESETYRVVNYSPGPIDTDMMTEISTDHPDNYERALWREARQSAIRPENSARKLMYLIEKNEYKNGAHIDIFDLDEDGEIIR